MKFIVDECTGPGVARWLLQQNFDVFSVYDKARGLKEEQQQYPLIICSIGLIMDCFFDIKGGMVYCPEGRIEEGSCMYNKFCKKTYLSIITK